MNAYCMLIGLFFTERFSHESTQFYASGSGNTEARQRGMVWTAL